MKKNQKLQVIYHGASIFTRKDKLSDTFDFYTAQAVDFALKSIEDFRRNGEECEGICGTFGHNIQRDIQVRLIK
jgi:hypothetical protein